MFNFHSKEKFYKKINLFAILLLYTFTYTFITISMFMGKKRKSLRYCRNYLRLHFIIIIKKLNYHLCYSNKFPCYLTSDTFIPNCKKINKKFYEYYFCLRLLTIERILYFLCCCKNYKKILKPLKIIKQYKITV